MTRRLCLLGPRGGVAGPAGFQRRLAARLEGRGHRVTHDLKNLPYDAVLVSGGTRHLSGLQAARAQGIRIVQRLDGMNWIHLRRWTGVLHFLRAEMRNVLLRRTRRMADAVVYQSEFVRGWWEKTHGAAPGEATVVHNGVPLDLYTPAGPTQPKAAGLRLLVVEANLAGGYEIGLAWAAELARRLRLSTGLTVELAVAGQVDRVAAARLRQEPISWLGLVPPEGIPTLDRSADLLFATDVHPACPNAAIEALACGLPVAGFDTGALKEVVGDQAGCIVPYGGDSWRLEPPDLSALTQAATEVLAAPAPFRQAARRRAEDAFDVEEMVGRYLAVLGWG